jgi:hypothetical protein
MKSLTHVSFPVESIPTIDPRVSTLIDSRPRGMHIFMVGMVIS